MATHPQKVYYVGMDRRHYYVKLASRYLELAPSGIDNMTELLHQYAVLGSTYSEPRRWYHNLDHIFTGHIMHVVTYGDMPAPEFFAWMYHDVVYEPAAPDNEVRSADMFLRDNAKIGFGVREADKVVDLILSTRHIGEKNVITDIDLVGLGFKPEVYDEYNALIRLEYSGFSADEWRTGRTAFLTHMLTSGPIFVTPEFFQYEAPAKENLRRELTNLVGEEIVLRVLKADMAEGKYENWQQKPKPPLGSLKT